VGVVLGEYDPARWRTGNGDGAKTFDTCVLAGVDGATVESAAREARVVAWANRARDLSNEPPNELTPERLAERAQEYAKLAGNVKVDALDRKQIEKLGMGAFAGVAQGSDNEPRLIVMNYEPANASGDVTLGLVGKAVTFD